MFRTYRLVPRLCFFLGQFLPLAILLLASSLSHSARIVLLLMLAASSAVMLFYNTDKAISHAHSLLKRHARRVGSVKSRLSRQRRALLDLAKQRVLYQARSEETLCYLCETAAETLQLTAASIWLFCDEDRALECVDLYERALHRHSSGTRLLASEFPEYFRQIQENRAIVIDDALANTSLLDAHQRIDGAVGAAIDAPIFNSGTLRGVVCFTHETPLRRWKIDEQDFAASIADMIAMVLEVDARRRVETDLEQKSRAIESAMDGIAILGPDERYRFVNKAHAELYGYEDPRELIGRHWSSLYDGDERQRFTKELMPLFRKSGSIHVESIGLKSDGSKFYQDVSLTALTDGGLVCVVRDVSERRKDRERLIESKRFLRSVIDTNPNFIFVKDDQGKFTLVNEAVAEAYGAPVEEIVGKTDADFNTHSDEVTGFQDIDRAVLTQAEEHFIPEEKITDAKGRVRWLQTVKRPLHLGDKVFVLGVGTDITEQKKLQEQLLQTQKLDAIGKLAGGIAHDFNNMLTAILGHTGLLKMGSHSREVLETAHTIESIARRAGQLTQKLLGFARKGKQQHATLEIRNVLEETQALIIRTIEKNITIRVQHPRTPLYIQGDPVQIEQVLLNLCINARDAMTVDTGGSDGGTLTLRAYEDSITSRHQSGLRPGTYVGLEVRDTGCGMSPALQQKIFEPFFTTKEEGKGTGLGLAMVYGIVKNHGGAITLESKEGEGSLFTILLPRAEGPRAIPNNHSDSLQPTAGVM